MRSERMTRGRVASEQRRKRDAPECGLLVSFRATASTARYAADAATEAVRREAAARRGMPLRDPGGPGDFLSSGVVTHLAVATFRRIRRRIRRRSGRRFRLQAGVSFDHRFDHAPGAGYRHANARGCPAARGGRLNAPAERREVDVGRRAVAPLQGIALLQGHDWTNGRVRFLRPDAVVDPSHRASPPEGSRALTIGAVAERSPQSHESWRLHSAHCDHAGGRAWMIAPGAEGRAMPMSNSAALPTAASGPAGASPG
jgi:hypothetical protein